MQCRIRSQVLSLTRPHSAASSLALAFALLLGTLVAHPVHAQTFTSLYSFPGGTAGANPGTNNLTVASNGWLLGATQQGGNSGCGSSTGCGVIYSLSPTGNQTVLHAFAGSIADDGDSPNGVAVDASSGAVYGTTSSGGIATSACSNGCGTVFKIVGDKETVMYSFSGSPDADLPIGKPILDDAGNLFTETFYGAGSPGNPGLGTVAEWSTAGHESLFHRFMPSSDGTNPNGGFVRDSASNFYGTTTYGGTGSCNNGFLPGCGVVFKIDTTGNETVLHDFTGGQDGQYPQSLIIDSAGNLYGITNYNGYGDIFEIDASGNFSVLYNGPSAAQITGIILGPNGGFYGTAGGFNSSCSSNCGIVFQMTPGTNGTWAIKTLHKFNGADGIEPDSLVRQGNVLYGTTFLGGTSNLGTVFKITL